MKRPLPSLDPSTFKRPKQAGVWVWVAVGRGLNAFAGDGSAVLDAVELEVLLTLEVGLGVFVAVPVMLADGLSVSLGESARSGGV
jgi:hypothetical protein